MIFLESSLTWAVAQTQLQLPGGFNRSGKYMEIVDNSG